MAAGRSAAHAGMRLRRAASRYVGRARASTPRRAGRRSTPAGPGY